MPNPLRFLLRQRPLSYWLQCVQHPLTSTTRVRVVVIVVVATAACAVATAPKAAAGLASLLQAGAAVLIVLRTRADLVAARS